MGYCRLVLYTAVDESGVSLVAAGWNPHGRAGGGQWRREGRERGPAVDTRPKQLWVKVLRANERLA